LRRIFAPEVVQTSAMDCGPAALKCLLEGFGVTASYGRLREACQTDVDGTSIDTLEVIAGQLGLDAEQQMVPVDHVLLDETDALPAIVVVRLPQRLHAFCRRVAQAWLVRANDGPGDGTALENG
jgi:ATP-binding cassette subfamily B protein